MDGDAVDSGVRDGDATAGAGDTSRFRRPTWPQLAAAAVAVFVVTLGSIAVFEYAAGGSLSSVVRGGDRQGSTLGDLTHPGSDASEPTPRTTPSPTDGVTPSPSVSPSQVPVTPSPTPSQTTPPATPSESPSTPPVTDEPKPPVTESPAPPTPGTGT